MRFLLIAVIISFSTNSVMAQNGTLPKNPKPGKCYERCFYYDKPLEWKAVDCKNLEKLLPKGVEYFTKIDGGKSKFIKYQQQLINLGYKLKVTGVTDNQTIKAHHKYLKFKEKQERKAKRKNRKQS